MTKITYKGHRKNRFIDFYERRKHLFSRKVSKLSQQNEPEKILRGIHALRINQL